MTISPIQVNTRDIYLKQCKECQCHSIASYRISDDEMLRVCLSLDTSSSQPAFCCSIISDISVDFLTLLFIAIATVCPEIIQVRAYLQKVFLETFVIPHLGNREVVPLSFYITFIVYTLVFTESCKQLTINHACVSSKLITALILGSLMSSLI